MFPGWGWASVGHAVVENVGDAMGEDSANEIVMKNKGNPIIYADENASETEPDAGKSHFRGERCCALSRSRSQSRVDARFLGFSLEERRHRLDPCSKS